MPLIKRKPKFNLTQFTQNLKAAEIRARQAKNKSDNSIPFLTQEVALNIQKKDVENAQVKAEALIKAERLSVALEELGLILEEVTEKAKLLLDPKSIPDSFLETLSALIYAIPRVDIKELEEIKKHLQAKLGKSLVREAMSGARVDPLIAEKFRLDVPLPVLVGDYLEKIALSQRKPQEQSLELPSVPSAKVGACSYGLKFPEIPSHPVISNKVEGEEKLVKASLSNVRPSDPSQDTLPSFEELSRRFEELKESKK